MTNPNPPAAAPKQETVELLKPHTHERKDLAPGARITVRDGLAKWLVDNGIGKIVKS
jgi:hypothetical protein